MRIVLASQSPSRLSILRSAGVEPLIHPAHVDEDALLADAPADPAATVALLATAKAEAVAAEYPGDVVIGADSMLLLNGRLQGKPHTVDATIARWGEQAGQSAELLTGHCVIGPEGRREVATSTTVVHFAAASPADIRAYAESGEPLECAGAFTLEALGGWFIDRIEGDPSSVIGLSLPLLRGALYDFGYSVSQFWNR
ncbi:Septum formation protein Maf [Corynebacterium occultum]|uniref:Nucleoside triphosphate pyrophosphatase n=1 Tax=Corynebacterium occultum TaxID=2675219 RepID=A0A6B8W990_9CORY|nr:nucleoside triphosphate pyrophosphatase [Corynebacterium occultum]QGU06570.1 Septum formation protein Maf [Corynebacterium occultum]